MIDLKKRKSYY